MLEDPAREDLMDRLGWLLANLRLNALAAPTDEELAAHAAPFIAARARIAARMREGTSPMAVLQQRMHLTDAEAVVLTLLAGVELSPEVRAQVLVDPATFVGMRREHLRRVVYGEAPSRDAMRELGPIGTLRRFGLIERCDTGPREQHESLHAWTIAPRTLDVLLGGVEPELALPALIDRDFERVLDRLAVAEGVRAEARMALDSDGVVIAAGLPHAGRRTLLSACAHDAGREVLAVDASQLSRDPLVLSRELQALARECSMLSRTALIANLDSLETETGELVRVFEHGFLPLVKGPLLVTCGASKPKVRWERPVVMLELDDISHAQRAALWRTALGNDANIEIERVAGLYPLAPGLIRRVVGVALARAEQRSVAHEDVSAAVRVVLDDRLGQYCTRVRVSQSWDDVVLPEEHFHRLIEVLARVRTRNTVYEEWGFATKVGKGLGVTALFSGPPGTGKTMVAGLIAKDLGLEIYQVDMAKIVSKFIGETEKNLAALFDAAEAGHAILLFDEADALFGKRTDVKSSNDRYANLETNYLLQRLEAYKGICILTTNHDSNIDPAFQRRLSLHLRFELPDEEERANLWRATLPDRAPVAANVDFVGLGRRFAMSGGHIKNAAMRAAFLAADAGTEISTACLEYAARLEYEGLGKIAA